MSFLSELDFDSNLIESLELNIPERIKELLKTNEALVTSNITYLKDLGISNYKDVFVKYYDTFLLDAGTFKSIFDKYEPEDLANKIKNNVDIVKYL